MLFNKTLAAAMAAVLLGMVACYSAPIMPPVGVVYANVNAPESLGITGQDLGTLRGKSSTVSILGLFAWGDASVKAAASAGNITNLKHIDYEFFNILGVYQRFTTVAYGD